MGQVSDELGARVDLALYQSGLSTALNTAAAVTGPARRRAGFLDEGVPKSQAQPAYLVPFVRFEVRQQLELGDHYMRIHNADGSLVMVGGAPYEIVTPYGVGDLAGLRWMQANDVIYFTHLSSAIPPYVLQRQGDVTWVFLRLDVRNGPWRPENIDETFTLDISGLTGVVNIQASKPLFDALHVGALFRIRAAGGNPGLHTWGPDLDPLSYQLYLSDGKVYKTGVKISNLHTGTTPPVHDQGTVSDGNKPWTFIHDGAGVVRITAVTDSMNATGLVLATMPTSGDGNSSLPNMAIALPTTSFWSEGAWSDYRGWPQHVQETGDERIAFAGTRSEPGGFFETRSFGFGANFVDFKPGLGTGRVVDDDAIRRTIGGGADAVAWLAFASTMMVGTARKEYAFGGTSVDDPPTPASNAFRGLSGVGGASIKAAETHDGVVFVPRGNRGLNQIRLGADQGYGDQDLAIFARDLVAGRIAKIVWAPHPDKTLWVLLETGQLLHLLYDPRQNAFGFHVHALGGGFVVEDLSVLAGPDGRDTLWLTVVRVKDGVAQRRIWRQAPPWMKGDDLDQVYYLDGGKIYDGAPASVLGGFDFWAGETVRVYGDMGRIVVDAAVSAGGVVTLPDPVSKAYVGMRYRSRSETLPLDISGPGGTLGQEQRPTAVTVYLTDFVVGAVSFGGGALEPVGGTPWGVAPAPVSLVKRGNVGGKTDRRATVAFETDDCWPATLLAIAADVSSNA